MSDKTKTIYNSGNPQSKADSVFYNKSKKDFSKIDTVNFAWGAYDKFAKKDLAKNGYDWDRMKAEMDKDPELQEQYINSLASISKGKPNEYTKRFITDINNNLGPTIKSGDGTAFYKDPNSVGGAILKGEWNKPVRPADRDDAWKRQHEAVDEINANKYISYDTKLAAGGSLTEYNGPSHAQGGIQLGGNVEVEGEETATTGSNKYVFPDKGFKTPNGKTIYVPGTKKTFAQQSKTYNNNLKLRPWDKVTKEFVDSKLAGLQQVHEEIKNRLDENAIQRFEKKNPGVLEKVADQLAQEKVQQIAQSQGQGQPQQTQPQGQVAGFGGNIYKWKNNYDRPAMTYAMGGRNEDGTIKMTGNSLMDRMIEKLNPQIKLGTDSANLRNRIDNLSPNLISDDNNYNVNATQLNTPENLSAEQYSAQGYNASTYNPTNMDSSLLKNAPGYVGNTDKVNAYNPISARQFVKSDNSEAIKGLEDSRSRTVKMAMQSDTGNPMTNALVADAMASKNKAGVMQDFSNQQANAKNAYNQYATSVDQANAQGKSQEAYFNSGVQSQNLQRQQGFNDSRLNTALDINRTNTGYANQAGQFNANSQNQANQFNVGAQNQANQYNANMRQNNAQYNSNMQYNTNAANAGYQNQANMYNAQNRLGVDQFNIGQKDAITNAQLGYLQGDINSQRQQIQNDQDREAQKKQNNWQNGLGLLGLGLKAAPLLGLSDKRTKNNIEKVDNIKGINIYNFNYKKQYGNPNIKHTGVIAQEVEKKIPNSVYENKKTGIKAVDYNAVNKYLDK